jgi:hypothetical protein
MAHYHSGILYSYYKWQLYVLGQFSEMHLWAGGVAQVLEHLPSKCRALSSNPSIANKQTKPKKQEMCMWDNSQRERDRIPKTHHWLSIHAGNSKSWRLMEFYSSKNEKTEVLNALPVSLWPQCHVFRHMYLPAMTDFSRKDRKGAENGLRRLVCF